MPPTAESTSCPRCGVPIPLGDLDITELRTQAAKTQGDVLVRKNVTLVGGAQCRNLTVFGKVLGRIECSGLASFRHSGRVLGKVCGGKIHIARGVAMEFAASVEAHEIEILGEAHGEFTCHGALRIGKKGRVFGPVSTRALVVEPGGHFEGDLSVLKPENAAPTEDAPPPHPPRSPNPSRKVRGRKIPATR